MEHSRLLSVIAALLFAHLLLNLYEAFVQEAHAGSTVDCRIVDINTYDKLKVQIADIDTSEALKVKMDPYGFSREALQVKVVSWEETDPVKVKIQE